MPETVDCGLCCQKGKEIMTKAKARLRAKANAARKAKKRQADAGQPEQKQSWSERFDTRASSKKNPHMDTNTKNFSGAKRGAARSG